MFIAASLPDKIISTAKKLLTDLGFSPYRADLWDRIVVFAVIILLAFIVWLVFAKGIIPIIKYIVNHSRLKIDRILYERKFFNRLFDLIPPIIVLFLLPLAFDKNFENVKVIIEKLMSIYLVFIFAKIIIALIEAAFDFYLIKHEIETSPYKGVVEMARIFIYCIMCLAIAGILLNLKIINVVTGLSAFAAVIVIVFKDTLLGFIAGLQLAQNRMVRIGDWVTVPNSDANGTVVEINILTVKIQNFDNTFVFMPSYVMVTNAFQNWCGMVQSGVRRVKKAVYIDVNTIIRLDDATLEKMMTNEVIRKYLTEKDFQTFSDEKAKPDMCTNLGVFRIWLYYYFNDHPNVTNQPYLIINNLQATGTGMPLQFLFFITTTDWATYENIQSMILEEIMSVMTEFGLKQFQYTFMPELAPKAP